MMKSYDYDAVTYDGEVYCMGCEPKEIEYDENGENEDVAPIFADSEWDYYPSCSKCGYQHTYMNLTSDGEKYEQEQTGPQEDDITISDSGPLGSLYSVGIVNGKFLGEYKTWEEVVAVIKEWRNDNKFYPTIWKISDHGDTLIININD